MNQVISEFFGAIDIRFVELIYIWRRPAPVRLFLWITLLGKMPVVLGLAALMTIMLRKWRGWGQILALWAGIGGCYLSASLLKIAIHRQRPAGIGVYDELSYSFPSIHATIAAFLFGFIAWIIVGRKESRIRRLLIISAAVLLIMAIGFSRLYLGVHFLSDVLGGYLLGALWLALCIRLAERWHLQQWRDMK